MEHLYHTLLLQGSSVIMEEDMGRIQELEEIDIFRETIFARHDSAVTYMDSAAYVRIRLGQPQASQTPKFNERGFPKSQLLPEEVLAICGNWE